MCVKGPSTKYVTLQRGRGSEKVWHFVTGGGWGVKIMWRHTFNFFTIHNFMLYFIFYHAYNTNLSCNYHLRSCKKLNLYGNIRVYYIETPDMVFNCYFLKFSSNDYSYLKAVSIQPEICLLTLCSEVWHTFRMGSEICDRLWQGEGGVKIHQKKRDILYERPQNRYQPL